jgi:hypothetical protein
MWLGGILVGDLVGAVAGGGGKRAQIPTRDRSQACFSLAIMLVCISLQILLAVLAGLLALLCCRKVFLSLPALAVTPRQVALLAFVRLCCAVWAIWVWGWLADA